VVNLASNFITFSVLIKISQFFLKQKRKAVSNKIYRNIYIYIYIARNNTATVIRTEYRKNKVFEEKRIGCAIF